MPSGVNIYRLLDEEALLKYIDALSNTVSFLFGADNDFIEELNTPALVGTLKTKIANLVVSLGLATLSSKRITYGEKRR